jgi:hypothetical protein
MKQSEQRRHTRFPVQGIFGSLRSPRDIRVVNLSRSGIAFETSEDLAVGESCFLELRHHTDAASIEILVEWSEPAGNPAALRKPVFLVGARFVDVFRDTGGGFWEAIAAHPEPRSMAS